MRSIALALFTCLAFAPALFAEITGKLVEYKQGETTFVGFLAWDTAVATPATPRPGVLVCPEWWGKNEYAHQRALQLASLGYVAFAIDLYGKDAGGKVRTTTDPRQAAQWSGEVMQNPALVRERTTAALAAFIGEKIVDASNIAAIGYCMGGTVAMELARTGADINAVVTFHASKVSAAVPADNTKIKASILVCHGADDAFVQPGELDTFQKQMKDAGVDYQLAIYSGAVHSFTNKDADTFEIDGVKYNANADKRSWEHMRSLFREKIAGERTPAAKPAEATTPPAPTVPTKETDKKR